MVCSAIPTVSIISPVLATDQPFRMSCHGHGNGTFNYSWPKHDRSAIFDDLNQNISFLRATKELAGKPFQCQVTVQETKRIALHTTELVVLGKLPSTLEELLNHCLFSLSFLIFFSYDHSLAFHLHCLKIKLNIRSKI